MALGAPLAWSSLHLCPKRANNAEAKRWPTQSPFLNPEHNQPSTKRERCATSNQTQLAQSWLITSVTTLRPPPHARSAQIACGTSLVCHGEVLHGRLYRQKSHAAEIAELYGNTACVSQEVFATAALLFDARLDSAQQSHFSKRTVPVSNA